MTEVGWVDDLLSEKSLWDVHKVSKNFPSKKFDRKIRWASRFGGLFVVAAGFWFGLEPAEEAEMVKAASLAIFTFCTTVVGFLVTGLAIFTTLSEKKIWIELSKTHLEDEGVSSFKYMFFNLLSVFATFLFGVAVSSTILVVSSGGFEVPTFRNGRYNIHVASFINGATLFILAQIFLEAMLKLKSFIWNLYSTFISMLTVSSIIDGADQLKHHSPLPPPQ